MRRAVVLSAALFLACSGQSRAQRWYYARGQQAKSWDTCLKLAVALRVACGRNLSCGDKASDAWALHCYAGVYQSSRLDRPARLMTTSPCSWQTLGSDGNSADAFAREHCARLGYAGHELAACDAELRHLTRDVCLRGDTALTGAGP